MSTSQIGTVLDALVDALRVRPGLSDVQVFSAPVSLEESGLETIQFGDAGLEQESGGMGGQIIETWTVESFVIGQAQSWEGDTETTIRAARDRTLELFAEVETHANDTYVGTLPDVDVTAGKLESGYGPETRACRLAFTTRVQAYKNP